MRPIDAIPLVQEAQRFRGVFKTDLEKYVADMFIRMLDFAPTIEAEPVKHGRWIDHCVRDWRCSECGGKIMQVRSIDGYCYDDKPNYCPDCGCKMDLED